VGLRFGWGSEIRRLGRRLAGEPGPRIGSGHAPPYPDEGFQVSGVIADCTGKPDKPGSLPITAPLLEGTNACPKPAGGLSFAQKYLIYRHPLQLTCLSRSGVSLRLGAYLGELF